ncbi:MAG: Si-specific NAD(P)(+) transhydrogenase [Gemmatimonadaceae bacterium]|nr:Si-specific NAD(P)(+) transhydrogenase [Gemmatimonadaceae bacterium]
MADHFDLLVIGAGPAGEKGAAQAAYFGKRVCVVERAPRPGGAAVNTGTVPSKTLRETALYFSGLRQRGLYGVEYHVKPDITIADFMFRERAVVEASWQLIDENFARHGITVVQGSATVIDGHTVEVTRHTETRRLTAETILLATGSHPLRPAAIPFDGEVVLDSDDILRMQSIPSRLVVIGGGVIGCEYAGIFGALGCRVTIVNARERLLTQLDAQVSEALRADMTRRLGAQVMLNAEVRDIRVDEAERSRFAVVTLTDGTEIAADAVLYSVGREGSTRDLGLEKAGIRTNDRGFVLVDKRYRTTVPTVYAAGDVIGFPALAATSMEQARVAMCHAFELKYKQELSPVLPYGVWTVPEIAMVGETEESAREKGLEYEIGHSSFRLNPRGQIIGDLEGFVKLVFRPGDQQLLGCSVFGEGACEMIHVAAAVLSFGGTIDYFIQSVFNYPTLSDVYKYAAYDGLQRLARRRSRVASLPSSALPGS